MKSKASVMALQADPGHKALPRRLSQLDPTFLRFHDNLSASFFTHGPVPEAFIPDENKSLKLKGSTN